MSEPDRPIPAYEKDPYQRRLEVEILEVGEHDGRPYAVLDDTLFFPEGGGQPADHGRLGAVVVVDVLRQEGAPRHFLQAPCETGPAVLELYWRRRYGPPRTGLARGTCSATYRSCCRRRRKPRSVRRNRHPRKTTMCVR